LDTVSWTIAALGPATIEEMGINPFALMDFGERNFLVKDKINNEKIEGFDLTNQSGRKQSFRTVWMEGTGFQTVTYQVLAKYSKELRLKEREREYLAKAIYFSDELEKVSSLVALPEGALPYTSKCPAEKEIILTFAYEWEIPRGHKGQWVSSLSSTMWRYFALLSFNPLVFDRETVRYKLFDE
jgi:hypothetical protein